MMRTLLTIATSFCLLSSCSSDTVNLADATAYNQQKASLAAEEKEKPQSFLKIYASDKKNLWGSTVVRGTVANSATVVAYKDVRIKMMTYDKAGAVLEEHEDVLHSPIMPNNSKDFTLRYHLPKNTDSVGLSIMSAAVVE